MNPMVSVITSTYNWPKALAQAIPTVLSQTFSDFEYIVVGDCCTDETEEVVHSFKDSRIKWYNLPKNTGNQSDVNKFALTQAKGKYVAYLNHDDLWFPDHLEVSISALRAQDLDVVNALALEIGADGHHFRGILGLPERVASGEFAIWAVTTAVVHTVQSANLVGGWTNWRETHHVPTQEFFHRLRSLRNRFAIVSAVTSLKFHSGDRKDSYVIREAREQELWAEQMTKDPNLRLRETLTAFACRSMGETPVKLLQPPRPRNAPPGWQVEQWRRMRGLSPMLDLGESEPTDIKKAPVKPSPIQPQKDSWTLISPIHF